MKYLPLNQNKNLILVKFETHRLLSPLLIFSVIPITLLFYFLFYLYYVSSSSQATPSDQYTNFLLITRLFSFLLNFIISLYSISLGIYTFLDPTLVFIINSINDKVKPYLAKLLNLQLVIMILALVYIFTFSIFSLFFYRLPPIEVLLALILTSFINTLCYTSVTFLGYALAKSFDFEPLFSLVIPISVFFILPQFIYGGISSGVFPILLYEFTLQYHLSTITNILLPNPFTSSVSIDLALISFLVLLFSISFSFIISLQLSRNFDYT